MGHSRGGLLHNIVKQFQNNGKIHRQVMICEYCHSTHITKIDSRGMHVTGHVTAYQCDDCGAICKEVQVWQPPQDQKTKKIV